jgi:hypothetical protein
MNPILKKLSDGAADAGSLARSIADSGLRSVNEVFMNMRIFSALTASSAENTEHDETHYILVPLPGTQGKHAVYTKRVLPPDTGAVNSLPKSRIFHVADEAGKTHLEQQLIANLVSDRSVQTSANSELADTLDKLADQIDGEIDKISGGLILIGGVVALVNPLLGVGIAAKALLPSIGAKASKAGAGYVGNMIRNWNLTQAQSKLRKEATTEVRRLKPVIYPNPVLRSLDAIVTNPNTDYDPAFDRRNWIDHFEPPHYYLATVEAIQEVYKTSFDFKETGIHQQSHVSWIKSLLDFSPAQHPSGLKKGSHELM